MAGAVIDGIDVLSTITCMLEEGLAIGPAAWVGGGAAFFLSLGLWGLSGLRSQQGPKI